MNTNKKLMEKIEDFIEKLPLYSYDLDYITDEDMSEVKDLISALLTSEVESIRNEIESLKGFSRCPDLWMKIKENLKGNIGMKGVSDFSFSQIALEAKDTTINEILKALSELKGGEGR